MITVPIDFLVYSMPWHSFFFYKREGCNGQDAPNLYHINRLKGLRARKPISLVYQFAIAEAVLKHDSNPSSDQG